MRCLLVDDEPGIREGLAALLRLRGHEVHTAEDVATASTLAKNHEFDLVLTDWCLPDGTALPLFDLGTAPIVVISGHPEEVAASPRVLAVMQKPLMPERLFDLVARCGDSRREPSTNPTATTTELPCDVRAVAERAIVLLAGATVELLDDGTFVTLRANGVSAQKCYELEDLGGDLRTTNTGDGNARCELRWCRDGRPDPGMPTVRAFDCWPASREFAVDFHDCNLTPYGLLACCERAAVLRGNGVIVHFLNVPTELRQQLEGDARTVLIPAAAPIGPRVGGEFADLWH
ncbi:MAG: response regulator [Planctomycetota bacterium]